MRKLIMITYKKKALNMCGYTRNYLWKIKLDSKI